MPSRHLNCWSYLGVLLAATLGAVAGPASADYFATPPCVTSPGCIFFAPKLPAQNQKIDVAIVPAYLPADARVGSLTETVSGSVIEISGSFVHCNCPYYPEPPPTFLYTSLAPLAAGHYSVQVTLSPDPPDGWPYGDGQFVQPIVLATTLDVLVSPPPPPNYEGLWWNSPAGSESGWGMNIAHQGDILFVTWFTYDLAGKGWWLAVTAPMIGPDIYGGTLYQTTGPAFSAVPFNPKQVTATALGSAMLTFIDANNATFFYNGVDGVSQTKAITREIFGPLPNCTFGAETDLAAATNYQDLWWAAPPGAESGWGINLTHQGDTIVATWFTYDLDGLPMWLVVTAPKTALGLYSGALYRTTGPAFNAVPFEPANVVASQVGSATFTFSDGNNASFTYTVDGVTQTKAITREVFQAPGTVCQ